MATTSPGLTPCGDQAAGQALDGLSIFGVGQAASAGSVHQRGLRRVAAAGVEHQIVQKKIVRIRVELGAHYAGSDCNGKKRD